MSMKLWSTLADFCVDMISVKNKNKNKTLVWTSYPYSHPKYFSSHVPHWWSVHKSKSAIFCVCLCVIYMKSTWYSAWQLVGLLVLHACGMLDCWITYIQPHCNQAYAVLNQLQFKDMCCLCACTECSSYHTGACSEADQATVPKQQC